jgi:hypothetical protein
MPGVEVVVELTVGTCLVEQPPPDPAVGGVFLELARSQRLGNLTGVADGRRGIVGQFELVTEMRLDGGENLVHCRRLLRQRSQHVL